LRPSNRWLALFQVADQIDISGGLNAASEKKETVSSFSYTSGHGIYGRQRLTRTLARTLSQSTRALSA
jgi:hypothetical protein